jgi:MFS transporter, ACS family, glucarate transporter
MPDIEDHGQRNHHAANLKRICVVAILVVLSMITYVDRTAISTAKEAVAAELGLSDMAMGMAFSAFALGYALMQIPAGWLADKFGPRVILGGAVSIWSMLTVLTGASWSFHSLLTFIFLFGAGEAAVFPCSGRAIRNWLEPGQRGRANGAIFAGSRIGAALSYPLLVGMLAIWNWRNAFRILGIVGIAWAILWFIWFRDFPSTDRSSETALEPDQFTPSTQTRLSAMRLAPAMIQYFASNFTNFICLSWMLPYLKTEYELTSAHAALYSMIPLLFGATSQAIAGWMVDRLYSSGLRHWSRRIPAVIGFALSAAGLMAVVFAPSVVTAVCGFTIAVFGADMTITPSWVFCADVGGKHTGGISGAMNMFGSIGAFVSANAFPFLHMKTGRSTAYFLLAAILDIAGIICWLQMRSLHFRGQRPGRELVEVTG